MAHHDIPQAFRILSSSRSSSTDQWRQANRDHSAAISSSPWNPHHGEKVTRENALTTAVSLHCFPNGLRTRPVLFDWWARVPRQPEETLGPLGRRSVEISLWQSAVQRRATTQR